MPTLKDIERVFECEANTLATPPFITPLVSGATLCSIVVPTRRAGYLVRAVVNWSVTFTPLLVPIPLTVPGFAQVTFQIFKDGGPIAIVTDSAGQQGFSVDITVPFSTASSTFETTAIQILDTSSVFSVTNPISLFELRATNVVLSPPLNVLGTVVTLAGSASAAQGLVSLVVEEIDVCRAASLNM